MDMQTARDGCTQRQTQNARDITLFTDVNGQTATDSEEQTETDVGGQRRTQIDMTGTGADGWKEADGHTQTRTCRGLENLSATP